MIFTQRRSALASQIIAKAYALKERVTGFGGIGAAGADSSGGWKDVSVEDAREQVLGSGLYRGQQPKRWLRGEKPR